MIDSGFKWLFVSLCQIFRIEFFRKTYCNISKQNTIFLLSIALTTFSIFIHEFNHDFEGLDLIIQSERDLNLEPSVPELMNLLCQAVQWHNVF